MNNYKLLILVFAVFTSTSANACDLCGCTTSSGNTSFGNLGMSNFVGLRYIYQSYRSQNGIFINSPRSEEQFNTLQLWGWMPVHKSFYVSTIIPYQDLTRNFQNSSEQISGLGDITVMGWYQFNIKKKLKDAAVFENVDRIDSGHAINFGIGIKAPTGAFEERLTDRINPGFQVGTGSWDFITSALYTYAKDKIGFNTTVSYYLKSENKNNYKFGNQFSFSSNAFYKLSTPKMDISPFVGISGDFYDAIEQYGETIADTDGYLYNASVGTEVNLRKLQIGGKFTIPVKQNLFGGNVDARNRVSIYLNYSL
ncbi:MAG: hypothetical protein AAF611_21675 [Bacteroidota bacterium]